MSKPRIYSAVGAYTPNARMDMRRKKKVYQHGREIAEREQGMTRAEKKEWKEMEARKHERAERKTEEAGDAEEVRKRMVGLAQKGAAEMEMDSALAMGKGRAGDTERSEEA